MYSLRAKEKTGYEVHYVTIRKYLIIILSFAQVALLIKVINFYNFDDFISFINNYTFTNTYSYSYLSVLLIY